MIFDVFKGNCNILIAGNNYQQIRAVFVVKTVDQKTVHGGISQTFTICVAAASIEIFEGFAFNKLKAVSFIINLGNFISPLGVFINEN